MSNNYRKQGSEYEKLAANFLQEQGLFIKEMNFYCKMGEVDIIARDGEYLCFIEVKYRTNRLKGDATEAVNYRKMRKICRVADYYMMKNNYNSDTNVRFDVVAIEEGHLNYIKNAFEYIG